MPRAATPERLSAFSDGVFAVLMFSVSLLPLSTAWMAVSELAPQPVSFYAAVFFLVNATYILLIWELIGRSHVDDIPPKVRRIMRVRAIATLCLFGASAVVALKYPLVGLGICVCCLVVYLKAEAPGAEPSSSTSTPRVTSVGAMATASGPGPAGPEEGSSSDTLPHRRS
jgi:uncharacterized membrane protein